MHRSFVNCSYNTCFAIERHFLVLFWTTATVEKVIDLETWVNVHRQTDGRQTTHHDNDQLKMQRSTDHTCRTSVDNSWRSGDLVRHGCNIGHQKRIDGICLSRRNTSPSLSIYYVHDLRKSMTSSENVIIIVVGYYATEAAIYCNINIQNKTPNIKNIKTVQKRKFRYQQSEQIFHKHRKQQ